MSLPNGQSYSFTYEPTPGYSGYYTGRLKRVTLPTGGYYEYQYPNSGNYGIDCNDGSVVDLTQVMNDGSTSNSWHFVRTQIDSSNWKTVVTAPTLPYDSAANQSAFVFTNGQQTSQKAYQGSEATGTLLRTVNTGWSSYGTPASSTVVLEDGTQSKTETDFNSVGNLTEAREYAWGSGSPGALVRRTTLAYLSSSAYTDRNILNRTTQRLVKDSSGAVKYREDISYDGSSLTSVTGAAQHDDTNYGYTFTTRGNPTAVTTYTNAATPSGGITRNFTYDSLGNLRTADISCCQQKAWSYSSTTSYAYPASVTSGPSSGPQLTTSFAYNSYNGLLASVTDENNQTASYAYDSMKRLTTVTRPDSKQVTTSYDDANRIITTTAPLSGTTTVKQIAYFDGLGRPIKTKAADGSGTSYSIGEVQYDLVGRAYKQSNPHNSSASYWTETRFDGLGRPLKVIPPDGSSSSNYIAYSYSGSTATVTDQAGKQRKTDSDALGRLVTVYEPDLGNSNLLTQQTTYTYNLLDALTQVSQGTSQTRSYTYDDMGRVTQQVTPEAGTWSFQYNDFGLVTQRTDARNVITNYSYDTLNRPTQVSYNVGSTGVPATSTVSYSYGTSTSSYNNGRLLTVTDGPGTETYTYDQLGRVTQVQKVISSTTYTTSYAYNDAGEMTQITYPSGRVVAQSFDANGRLCAVGASGSTCSTGTTYVTGFTYNTAQQVTAFNYGNGVAASIGYSSDRLQMTSLSYAKSGTTLLGLSYYYKYDASNCSTGTTGNNGQIQCITDSVNSGRNVAYTYDPLARLSTATTTGSTGYPAWGLSWTYDRYGNRTGQSIASGCTGITCPTNSISVSATTNRITTSGYGYDANGNLTNDGANSMVYDAENRVVSINSGAATYTYDGAGLRVKKVSGSTTTVYIFSGAKVVAEYVNGAAVGSPTREYIYSGSALVAKIESSATQYFHQDHLSNRVISDSSGNVAEQRGQFPFGESWYEGTSPTKFKFTTYERDAESGNDYAMARYYVNRLGRFNAPDPLAGSPGDPQSLNRYAYARNAPTILTDPTGLAPCYGTVAEPPPSGDTCPPLIDESQRVEYMGYDMFDAIAGAPGTYLTIDARGNIGWGFDLDLYRVTMGRIDAERAMYSQHGLNPSLVPTTGYLAYVTDYGTGAEVSGIIPDLMKSDQEANLLVQTLPEGARKQYEKLLVQGATVTQAATFVMNAVLQNDPSYRAQWGMYWGSWVVSTENAYSAFGAVVSAPLPACLGSNGQVQPACRR